MASVTRRLVIQSTRCPRRIQTRQIAPRQQWQRPLSTTAPRSEEKKDANAAKPKIEAAPKKNVAPAPEAAKSTPKDAAPKTAAPAKKPKLTPEEINAAQLEKLMADLDSMRPENIGQAKQRGEFGIDYAPHHTLRADEDVDLKERGRVREGFWNEGQESMGADDDYYGDDITSHGHGQLEEHRELREYARMIAWELPLLNQLAKPFELPTAKTPFRFRYTSYMGESHPAANKVVVEFSASDMPNLTPLQKDKLIKLAGPRYNPSTDIIKMSCELYDTLPQNKRFLGDTISKLLAEARDGKDTFADVPFDFRHHKEKKRYVWPKEWNMTEERKKVLQEKRAKVAKLDDQRKFDGSLVDGVKVIEGALPFGEQVAEPVMVPAGKGKQKMLR